MNNRSQPTCLDRLVFGATVLLLLAAGWTGVYSWIRGAGLSGWLLFLHCCVGPAFAVGLTLTALLRAEGHRLDRPEDGGPSMARRIAFWLVALFGLLTIGSIMASMLPVVAADDQAPLYWLHRYGSLPLMGAMAWYLLTGLTARARKEQSCESQPS